MELIGMTILIIVVINLIDNYKIEELKNKIDYLEIQNKLTECKLNLFIVDELLKEYNEKFGGK